MLSSSPKASGTVAPSYSYQLPFIRRPFRRLASSFEILHQRAFLALPLSDRQCGGPCLASPDLHMTVLRSTRAGPNCSAEPVASLPIAISVQGQEPRRNISRPKRYLCGYESLAVLLILSHEPRFVLAICLEGRMGRFAQTLQERRSFRFPTMSANEPQLSSSPCAISGKLAFTYSAF